MKRITVLFLLIIAIVETHAQNYQISFAAAGAITTIDSVKVENLTQCTSLNLRGSDILHLIVSTGINELNKNADNTLCIYPNPMTDGCSIDFEATVSGKTTLELFDMTGKRVLQIQELLSKGHHTYNLSGISSGMYSLKIESDNYSYTAKIISSNATSRIAEIKHIEIIPDIDRQNKASNTRTMRISKGGKSMIDMQYHTGDILKFTGKSGNHHTVLTLVPTQTQTVTYNFIACTDADSNHYAVVQIGTQLWMAENLKVGAMINSTTSGSQQTNNGIIERYCYNNDTVNCNVYGGLYEWNEMMQYALSDTGMTGKTQGVCPSGWHIPTHHEWTTLTTYLGGESVACGKLKETGTIHWNSPNIGATNSSGFTALPGSSRDGYDGSFRAPGYFGGFWTATEYGGSYAWGRYLSYGSAGVSSDGNGKTSGFSVRCLKDN